MYKIYTTRYLVPGTWNSFGASVRVPYISCAACLRTSCAPVPLCFESEVRVAFLCLRRCIGRWFVRRPAVRSFVRCMVCASCTEHEEANTPHACCVFLHACGGVYTVRHSLLCRVYKVRHCLWNSEDLVFERKQSGVRIWTERGDACVLVCVFHTVAYFSHCVIWKAIIPAKCQGLRSTRYSLYFVSYYSLANKRDLPGSGLDVTTVPQQCFWFSQEHYEHVAVKSRLQYSLVDTFCNVTSKNIRASNKYIL